MQHSQSSPSPVDIAIVGGGASGVLLAAQLVRKARLRVALIERDAHPGLGVAYSTHCLGHLLNVRASDMTALADEPDHFVQWLARDGRGFGPTDFVPRAIYGRYLQDLLADAIRRADGRLQVIRGHVVAIRHGEDGVELDIEGHAPLRARKAVLATGHRPPSKDSGAYRGNPWRDEAIAGLPPEGSVLMIGTSLTMIDVLISLLEHGQGPHRRPVAAWASAASPSAGADRHARRRHARSLQRQPVATHRPVPRQATGGPGLAGPHAAPAAAQQRNVA